MTIEPMKKVTLCGLASDKEAVLAGLQDLGCAHLIPLAHPGPLEAPDRDLRRRAQSAYRHLAEAPVSRRPWPTARPIDLDTVIASALANKNRLRAARDRRDFLVARIAALAPFGDFEIPPEAALRGMKLWFYILPVKQRRALQAVDLPWQVVGREPARLFVAVLSREEPRPDLLPVPRTHTGSRQLSVLKDDLEDVEIEIEQAQDELAELTRSRLALGLRLAEAQDDDERRAAGRITRDEDRIFALQGWVPAASSDAVGDFARMHCLALTMEDPSPGENPPTLLANPGEFQGVGAITNFYMTPSYHGWDPSLVVFSSFAIFFAMILADAGYALVLAAIVWLYRKKIGRSAAGKRLLFMLYVILGTAFVYGIFAGGYFGIHLPKDSLLARIAFIDLNDFGAMMQFSVVIGVLHISLANAEMAWQSRGTPAAVVKLGWIAATFGGLIVWLGPRSLGLLLVIVGLATVFAASAVERKVAKPLDWLLRLADGSLALTGVTKLFGDILSYMRLFALGLASASLAVTFNQLAVDIHNGIPGIGLLLAILVLFLGHAVNLLLGILSGVVHGLRLNFIEFFGWGLPAEEGYPFKAFARKERTS